MKLPALLLLLAATPVIAGDIGFTNRTKSGLRCRLATDTQDTAMTITLEVMEQFSVSGPYRSIRCDEPVVRQRFDITDGGNYVFHKNKDGNTISLRQE